VYASIIILDNFLLHEKYYREAKGRTNCRQEVYDPNAHRLTPEVHEKIDEWIKILTEIHFWYSRYPSKSAIRPCIMNASFMSFFKRYPTPNPIAPPPTNGNPAEEIRLSVVGIISGGDTIKIYITALGKSLD
jgi:hypothetical protein